MLTSIASPTGFYQEGQVTDVPEAIASKWLKAGIAMMDKSMDGAKEIKTPLIIKRKTYTNKTTKKVTGG